MNTNQVLWDQQQETTRFPVALTAVVPAVPDHAQRSASAAGARREGGTQYYEAEWVTPDSDGWALWSDPAARHPGPVYGRTVLAVPNGDGWTSCEDGDDLDTANRGEATESR